MSQYSIIKNKNFIILISKNEDQTIDINNSLKKYFLRTKKNITQYAIMSEFAYATDNFIFTSQSIAEALGITAKTVRTKLKDLENDKYIYDFKFSTGTDSSRSYYIINLSDQKISRHKALALLLTNFNELYAYSLITYNTTSKVNDIDLNKIKPIYEYYKKNYLKTLKITSNAEQYIYSSMYETFNSNIDKMISIYNDVKSNNVLEEFLSI